MPVEQPTKFELATKLDVTLVPTFNGEDMDVLGATARMNLGLFTTSPFFQRSWPMDN